MMSLSHRFFTPTMAKLYADQGYLRKAVQIYRHLVQQEPDRGDLRQDLAAVEERIRQQTHPSTKELGLLMREWADLIRKHQELKPKG
jgi:adenylosuccinate lyase